MVLVIFCHFNNYPTQSWDSSLDSMVRPSRAPLVFTEYYLQDCQLNLDKLIENTKKKVKVALKPSANPFCSRFVEPSIVSFLQISLPILDFPLVFQQDLDYGNMEERIY